MKLVTLCLAVVSLFGRLLETVCTVYTCLNEFIMTVAFADAH